MGPNVPSTSAGHSHSAGSLTDSLPAGLPRSHLPHPPHPLHPPPPPQRSTSSTLNKGTSKEVQRQKSTFISCTHW